jgi:hypothetical protein
MAGRRHKIIYIGGGGGGGGSTDAAQVIPTYNVTGNEVNVTKRLGVLSLTGDVTLTASGTPTANSQFGVALTADGTSRTVTTAWTSKSFNRGTNITSFVVPAGLTAVVGWWYDGTTYYIFSDPVSSADVKTGLAITIGDTTGTVPVNRGGTGLTTLGTAGQQLVVNGTGTGYTHADPGAGSGDVVGPASAVDDSLAIFDGTTGKLIQVASGWSISAEGELTRSSDGIPGSWGFGDAQDPPVFVHLSAPETVSAEYTLAWPTSAPTAGQALVVDTVTGSVVQLKGGAAGTTITTGTAAPSGGADGDIYLQYT